MSKLKIIELLRTKRTVTVEVYKKDLEDYGFDSIWDEVRFVYEENRYRVKKITENETRMKIKFHIITIK